MDLGDDGEDQAGGGNGHGAEGHGAAGLQPHEGQVAADDEPGPRQGAHDKPVVPRRADYQHGPKGPEDDHGVEKPVLVVPGPQFIRRARRLALLLLRLWWLGF